MKTNIIEWFNVPFLLTKHVKKALKTWFYWFILLRQNMLDNEDFCIYICIRDSPMCVSLVLSL